MLFIRNFYWWPRFMDVPDCSDCSADCSPPGRCGDGGRFLLQGCPLPENRSLRSVSPPGAVGWSGSDSNRTAAPCVCRYMSWSAAGRCIVGVGVPPAQRLLRHLRAAGVGGGGISALMLTDVGQRSFFLEKKGSVPCPPFPQEITPVGTEQVPLMLMVPSV